MKKAIKQKAAVARSHWYVWLFPVIALCITGWLFLDYFKERGPMIRVYFEEASSIAPEKTRVRFRGVNIGLVKDIEVSPDNRDVVAFVQLNRDAKHFAVEGSKFWIVVPKVGFQGVQGLETLFQGPYIAASPGDPASKRQTKFNGKIGSESTDALEETSPYHLEAQNAETVNPGDSVTFRGVKVGEVTKVNFSKSAQSVLVQINIQNRYVKLIRTNTFFWRKMAVQAKLGLFNSEVKVNSLDSILHGGIEFFTPDNVGEMAKAGSKFSLVASPPKGWEKWNPKLD